MAGADYQRPGEISLDDIRAGRVWKQLEPLDADGFVESGYFDQPLEDQGPVIECTTFEAEDTIVYSGLVVFPDGRVEPILMLHEFGNSQFGGDFLVRTGGRWVQLGLVPNPEAPIGEYFFAAPRADDNSFDAPTHDERALQRDGFARHVAALVDPM